jgi:hypothetical protein
LKTYTGEDLKPIGVANVNVQYREKSYDNLPLFVVEKGGHALFGRDWLKEIPLEGHEKPIAFASRTLNPAEKNYAQIDKEALGLIWGIQKLHTYLYGRKFILETNHQPLVHIFNHEKGISSTTSARIQRYATFLPGYDYEIVFRKTEQHANADVLSRLPLQNSEKEVDNEEPINVFHVEQIENLPVSNKEIQIETSL